MEKARPHPGPPPEPPGVRPSSGAETSEYPMRSNFAKAFGTSKLAAPGTGALRFRGSKCEGFLRRILSPFVPHGEREKTEPSNRWLLGRDLLPRRSIPGANRGFPLSF